MTAPTRFADPTPPPGRGVTPEVFRRRFPGIVVWFGLYTRQWWAVVRVGQQWRLVEGPGLDELTGAIMRITR
ncbi:hypothetical protein [Actinomadura xylanilytica]|uniref:hypothetical protein n=1 Tax=Actinomadura xylanilytica TaxID=887459 RepID=UPI00255ADEB6|nr:hypothetical protein [Actinomadura xylanilytica]MDL4777590.1 hypothetical protein [Actinomadura xylanilytica]